MKISGGHSAHLRDLAHAMDMTNTESSPFRSLPYFVRLTICIVINFCIMYNVYMKSLQILFEEVGISMACAKKEASGNFRTDIIEGI